MTERVYVVNIDKAKLSSHTPRRKLAVALLEFEFSGTAFPKEDAEEVLGREGLLEGTSFESLWRDLEGAGFVYNPYE